MDLIAATRAEGGLVRLRPAIPLWSNFLGRLERNMENVEERSAHAIYEHFLYRNMLIDSQTDYEV